MPLLLLLLLAWPLPRLDAEPVANLFIHPLLAWPEKAFDPANKDRPRMDEWFITANEFRRALEALDSRGYLLVRPSDLGGPLDLPPGKKPLLLSMDDLNYYPYMRRNGTVSKLLVVQGRLVARTPLPGGGYRDDLDREAPQVLESYLETHPGFSYRGARGMIAVTGYAGLFGWPVQWAGPDLAEARTQAKAVADKLKQLGWEFASHSYAHRSDKKQPFEEWKASEVRWDNEIQPLIGPTPYYVFPFGEKWEEYPDRWALLKEKGYRVFFGVETTSRLDWLDGLPIYGRVPLDGRALRHRFGILSPFLDAAAVIDPLRPAEMQY